MMNHINSYTRKKLNNQSPHQVFSFLYGTDILKKLGAVFIPANEITLKPEPLSIEIILLASPKSNLYLLLGVDLPFKNGYFPLTIPHAQTRQIMISTDYCIRFCQYLI